MERAPLVTVVGPTASGKSDLALALAAELGGEIVNADALQLYRGMDIGTAKLRPEQREGIAHHQLDVLEVTQEASVSAYQQAAREDIAAIRARGRVPVLVGGSGLYIRAVLDDIEFPPTDPVVRARYEQRATKRVRSSCIRSCPAATPRRRRPSAPTTPDGSCGPSRWAN